MKPGTPYSNVKPVFLKDINTYIVCFCLESWQQYTHGVQRMMISVDNFFVFFEIIIFCCVVAICDLVHDVETIFHLSYVLKAS